MDLNERSVMCPRGGAAVQRADVSGLQEPSHRGQQEVSHRGRLLLLVGEDQSSTSAVCQYDSDFYLEQLQRDAKFLCSDLRMDTELVDTLVLQLNRIYPQILSDKEARRFRNLSVPTKVRFAELLKHLYGKGEDTCHEFYRGLHIHAEDVYSSLPSRVRQKEVADPKWTNGVVIHPERFVLNDRGPMFFLSCFSFVAGIAILFYYGDGETLRRTGPFLRCSAARLASKGAKDVLITYAEVGKQRK
ncbi:caspase recruitment domain-containing protein 19-like [Limanda limanda]|uniref:caspase recruitment domain-containing protein 19-like n=1 Tax=Limanda limanda TaxID=27771 RepID=UPI0029C67C4C|nr:caspase recruitment domain-containing protein 19-like [Limanda limanda]